MTELSFYEGYLEGKRRQEEIARKAVQQEASHGHRVGDRVQLHPATDAWMRGDRYGDVVKVGTKHIHVKMDRSGRTLKVHPSNIGDNYDAKKSIG
jgi:hypothetical protein